MRFVGIGWRDDSYIVAALETSMREPVSTMVVPAPDRESVLMWLRSQQEQASGQLIIAVDSTSGVLAEPLLAAGLPVYRIDSRTMLTGPAFGSADPVALAGAARDCLAPFAEARGPSAWLAGREAELDEGALLSAEAESEARQAGKFINRGTARRREIALTFDDGPDPLFSPKVCDILARYSVAATFFCIGLNSRAYPGLIESITEQGHTLGNHTWSHPLLPDLSVKELAQQLESTNETIARITNQAPKLFRPPYGAWNPTVLRQLADWQMTSVTWDVDPMDWSQPGADEIEKLVVDQAKPGSIVLLHDSGGDREQTVAALPGIVESLLADGYHLVPVDAMLRP
jgi:peptidoglycan-N-acetylglucosamine deacetylase